MEDEGASGVLRSWRGAAGRRAARGQKAVQGAIRARQRTVLPSVGARPPRWCRELSREASGGRLKPRLEEFTLSIFEGAFVAVIYAF